MLTIESRCKHFLRQIQYPKETYANNSKDRAQKKTEEQRKKSPRPHSTAPLKQPTTK